MSLVIFFFCRARLPDLPAFARLAGFWSHATTSCFHGVVFLAWVVLRLPPPTPTSRTTPRPHNNRPRPPTRAPPHRALDHLPSRTPPPAPPRPLPPTPRAQARQGDSQAITLAFRCGARITLVRLCQKGTPRSARDPTTNGLVCCASSPYMARLRILPIRLWAIANTGRARSRLATRPGAVYLPLQGTTRLPELGISGVFSAPTKGSFLTDRPSERPPVYIPPCSPRFPPPIVFCLHFTASNPHRPSRHTTRPPHVARHLHSSLQHPGLALRSDNIAAGSRAQMLLPPVRTHAAKDQWRWRVQAPPNPNTEDTPTPSHLGPCCRPRPLDHDRDFPRRGRGPHRRHSDQRHLVQSTAIHTQQSTVMNTISWHLRRDEE